jgi:uncharacterized protein (DUF2235 family)
MKRLVVCFDGTWNDADGAAPETNVVRLARAVRANSGSDQVQQITLYVRGVGSSGTKMAHYVDGAVGIGVDENIHSGYQFIAQNFVPGDEIFLFGFSRGAFTARSLAGFIGASGLAYRQSLSQLGRLWAHYRTPPANRDPAALDDIPRHDKAAVRIKFLGVWDTVGALGVPSGWALSGAVNAGLRFHDTTPSSIVENAFHALAIDEFRDAFVPTLWTGTLPAGATIEQVWFAGAHSDVGGGYVDRALADIPLVWMAGKAEDLGLKLDWDCLPAVSTDELDPLAPRHDSRHGFAVLDKFTPTIRKVCEFEYPAKPWERFYTPLSETGVEVATINESVHASVYARMDGKALLSTDDDRGERQEEAYGPVNVPRPVAKTSD